MALLSGEKNESSELYELFGSCPECGRSTGYVHRGRKRWVYCKNHKTKWCGGEVLSCHWEIEENEDYTRIEAMVSAYHEVEPLSAPCPVAIKVKAEMTDKELVQHLRDLANLIENSHDHRCFYPESEE